MNCELLNCTYVFVYSPKNKLTTWNPKTSLLYVCISSIRLLSPNKKLANIGNWKRTKITPYNEKKRQFISIIWIYTPVPVANWKSFIQDSRPLRMYQPCHPGGDKSRAYPRHPGFHGVKVPALIPSRRAVYGMRMDSPWWTRQPGILKHFVRRNPRGKNVPGVQWDEPFVLSFKNSGHDEESYMIFAWIVVEDVGFMKISLHSGSLWVVSNCSFLTLTLVVWLVVLEGFSFSRLTMIWFCLILPRQ